MEVAIKSDNTIHHYVRHSSNQFLFDVVTLGEDPHDGRPMQVVVAREQHNRESIAFDTDGNSFYTVSEAGAGGNERPVFRYDRGLGTSNAVHGGAGVNTLTRGAPTGTLEGHASDTGDLGDVNLDGDGPPSTPRIGRTGSLTLPQGACILAAVGSGFREWLCVSAVRTYAKGFHNNVAA
jgi:hypothetical protein